MQTGYENIQVKLTTQSTVCMNMLASSVLQVRA